MSLKRKSVQFMDWLARPPDMNSIEHVWDCLQISIAASYVQCGTRESPERKLVDDRGIILLADIPNFI